MAKEVIDYVRDELSSVKRRLKEFTDYGYSPELEPLVDEMCKYKQKLEELELKERNKRKE